MHITTLGDVMLDVIVAVPGGLRHDDDTEAQISLSTGGQAANVATWAAELGARATLIGPHGSTGAASVIAETLERGGIGFVGIKAADAGTVVSILTQGSRTMASDPGDQTWLAHVNASMLPADTDRLHLSAYPLLRSADPFIVQPLVAQARELGARVSIDLSSATLIESHGVEAFRHLLEALGPDLVFANVSEWEVLGVSLSRPPFDVVLKNGAAGATVVAGGVSTTYPALAVEAVDATGAGDALAAGYLVGGADMAMQTAARCVARLGAQPPLNRVG